MIRRLALSTLLLTAFTFSQTQKTAPRPAPNNAATALWRDADLNKARLLAAQVLHRDRSNADALFVDMEAAVLAADTPAVWHDALALCRTDNSIRATLAGERLRELGANTAEFRRHLLALAELAHSNSLCASDARAALVAAAADGVPFIDSGAIARADGLLTRWRIAGPYGHLSNLDFDRNFPPEKGDAAGEPFDFANGEMRLPLELSRRGVLYASADFDSTGAPLELRIESPGTLAVFVDGSPILTKDDRLRTGPERVTAPLRLGAGEHRILIKFVSAAAPFRVAVGAPLPAPAHVSLPEPEQPWAEAQLALLRGDLPAATAAADALLATSHSAVNQVFAADVGHAIGVPPQEILRDLRSAIAASPDMLLAELRLSAVLLELDQPEEAHDHLARVLAVRPDLPEAQELATRIALRRNDAEDARRALAVRLRLAPDCDTISAAIRFYSADDEFAAARRLEGDLRDCAPGSLAYAHQLSDTGRHNEAVSELRRVISNDSFDREARLLLIAELRLAGDTDAAGKEAAALTSLAPSLRSRAARALTGDGISALAPFYLPYRRDGLHVIEQAAHRSFTGGPAVFLLRDRIVALAPDGRLSLYVHELTRVLDRDGIQRYGEVAVPPGASLLELRTIKLDGTVLEPELAQGKATVSMPGLAPGDAVEVEYVLRYDDTGGIAAHRDAARFAFGSFDAPVLNARFVVVAPPAAPPRIVTQGDVPQRVADSAAWLWERHDIPQISDEPGAPPDALPQVALLDPAFAAWGDVQNEFRDALIDAVRITPQVARLAATLRARTDEETARAIFRYVTTHIAPADGTVTWDDSDIPSADETLAETQGSRTALAVALARAAGLDTGVILVRSVNGTAEPPSLSAFTRPIVRFHLRDGRDIFSDVEQDLVAFGVLPPALDRARALRLSLAGPAEPAFVSLPPLPDSERSTADADLLFDPNGDLHATLRIRFGASRSAEVRAALRTIAPADRQQYFERLATRIFPGADTVTGTLANENDSERPLLLTLTCRTAAFLDVAAAGGTLDADQFVPALGLRNLFPNAPARAFPLDLTSLLFEQATFRLTLPPDLSVERLPAAAHFTSPFGTYDLTFTSSDAHHLEITRAFRLLPQRIAPAAWPDFSRFAAAIDAAERPRVTLTVSPVLAQR